MTSALRVVKLGQVDNFVVVSDVHLKRPTDFETKEFIRALETCRGVPLLVLLGDIFDFVFAGQNYFQRHWNEVFGALEDLASRGTQIAFVEGNHDFGFEHFLPDSFRKFLTVVGDIEVQLRHPKLGNVSLRHGDDVVCKPDYIWFRNSVKSKLLQGVTRHLPGSVLDKMFLVWANLSRRRHTNYDIPQEIITSCVQSYLEALPVTERPQTLVLGHVHCDADYIVDGTRVLIGPDWLRHPGLLFCDASGQVERRYFNAGAPAVLYR